MVTPYADWKKIKAFADALVAVTNDNDEANGTLRTAINDNNTSVEAATAEGTITTATATLKTAMTTYVNTANPVGDGAQFDCTFMLTNPDVSGFANGDKPAGWYCDYSELLGIILLSTEMPFHLMAQRMPHMSSGLKMLSQQTNSLFIRKWLCPKVLSQ